MISFQRGMEIKKNLNIGKIKILQNYSERVDYITIESKNPSKESIISDLIQQYRYSNNDIAELDGNEDYFLKVIKLASNISKKNPKNYITINFNIYTTLDGYDTFTFSEVMDILHMLDFRKNEFCEKYPRIDIISRSN